MRNRKTYSRFIQNVPPWNDFSKGKVIQLLHHCVENDITSFDTSDFEGIHGVENVFGIALSESGLSRDEIQLISKYGAPETDGDNLIRSVDQTLLDLETDYLDLLLLDYRHLTPDFADAVERLRSQGKVLEVGGLNLEEPQVREFSIPMGVNQIPSPFANSSALDQLPAVERAAEEIIHFVWCGHYPRLSVGVASVIHQLCATYQVSEEELFHSWILQHPAHLHPIICAAEKEHISTAVSSRKIQLDPVDWQKIQLLLS